MPVYNQRPAPRVPYQYQEFPKSLNHPDGRTQTAHGPEDEARLVAEGWSEQPFPKKPEAPPQNLDIPSCARCDNQRKKFDQAWAELAQQHADLRAAHAQLDGQYIQMLSDNQQLLDALKEAQAAQASDDSPKKSAAKK